MKLLPPEVVTACYILAAVLFILALKGLGNPRTARRANLLGAAGAAIAVLAFCLSVELRNIWWIIAAVVVGAIIAVPAARRVQMTQMPQLVAAFNGVGGGAAALVALVEVGHSDNPGTLGVVAFTVLIGGVSLTGSFVTFGKLQGILTSRAVTFPGLRALMVLLVVAALAAGTALVLTGDAVWSFALVAIGLVLGVLLVLPIGGADVPIVISLLNAFTGLAVAASGIVLGNVLLLIAGTLVGASGTILTMAMAKAMGRTVTGIVFGAFRAHVSAAAGGAAADRPVRTMGPDDVAILLDYAQRVVIVPGYGLAVAGAHHAAAELAEVLRARGVDVVFGIHPVAGRMPGHMNVLLAEANVPYDALVEMDEVNPRFRTTDLVLVVGANDVVNPAAKTSPGSPIYGMPILTVADAQQVVFLKRSLNPGFAGIDNELFFDPKVSIVLGDAKHTLTKILAAVKTTA
ncbi:NAD(P)(+) transhydrogenase (Re/Si-specific) subunit beta [Microbacterium sp. CFBP9034]|uniref:NAD(P)(+) transhydrogenase (Re/Si-specific) subunit beta n=1 Tax=Microbacterium sp. CFBP9034 TaxID=3096540 RepID=UPI002A69C249|nr:NAD(P)(+) transhydrogenase (Re/Si-specific) subunit beta [Microbacterium sp. CFBP9034]MDY0910905.1 NAD(P)(+) transhydrogenase (Re/Si-specific) subunit beta [Microbacterium sp. CFBP9034]